MPGLRTPRERWVDEGLRALAAGGVEAVRVERLAATLGVTKGGFYGFFADRAALLTAMLDRWEELLVTTPIAVVDAGARDGRARLRRLFAVAAEVGDARAVEVAIREWGRRDADAAARVRRVDERRMAYLRELFADVCADAGEVEARSLLTCTLFVGGAWVTAGHGERTRAEVIELTLDHLLR